MRQSGGPHVHTATGQRPHMQWRRPLECATLFPAMAERTSFIVLKYVNKTLFGFLH